MAHTPILVRPEAPMCAAAIRDLHQRAFGRSGEGQLVDVLRQRGAFMLSLVAVLEEQIVGHILFTPVAIDSGTQAFSAVGLGPMGVLPEYQQRGIGSQLVRVGLAECRGAGHELAVVLGHPQFYPRFGFAPARPRGIDCEYAVPDDVFMVAELRPGALAGRRGMARYQPEFSTV